MSTKTQNQEYKTEQHNMKGDKRQVYKGSHCCYHAFVTLLKWYEVDNVGHAHNLFAAREADTLSMGTAAIMKRSSWNINRGYYMQD